MTETAGDDALKPHQRAYLERAERLIRAARDPDWIKEWEEAVRRDRAGGPTSTAQRVLAFQGFQQRSWMRPVLTAPGPGRLGPQRAPRGPAAAIGANLRAERVRAGLGLRELAERTGIARSTLSRIELGARSLRFDEAVRIAGALGIELERLARGNR